MAFLYHYGWLQVQDVSLNPFKTMKRTGLGLRMMYDARMEQKARSICQMFGPDKSEINFDLSESPKVAHLEDIIHTMTWQDRKYHSYETLESQIAEKFEKGDNYVELSFTFHSTVSSSSS